MIRLFKYIYWYIMALIAYMLSRKEISGSTRWQYYCWMIARQKSRPKAVKKEKENNNDN